MNEEVTEKGVISVTPEPNKPNSATRRDSTGKANTTSSPYSSSDGIPHYLRASTGSCHDFCKYGRKHDFDAKKRHPILPTFLGSTGTINEEYNQRKVPALRNRRKTPEITLNQPKNAVSSGRKVIKKKGMLPAPDVSSTQTDTPDIPFTQVDESSEDVLSITSLEHTPASLDKGSSKEPVSIKLMVPPPCIALADRGSANQASLLEEAIALQLGTPSPTRKTVVTTEHIPLTCGSLEHTIASSIERSTEEPVNIELMSSSPFQESVASPHSLPRQAERSSKKPISLKARASPSIHIPVDNNFADVAEGPGERRISIKPQHPLPIQKSSVPAKCGPSSRTEKFSRESVIAKLKTVSLVRKNNSTAEHTFGTRTRESSEKQGRNKSLGLGDQKKRQATKLKSALKLEDVDSAIVKVIKQMKIDVSGHPDTISRKTWSPVKKISVELSVQKSPQKTLVSRTPKTIKQTASSPPISLKSKTAGMKSTSPLVSSQGLTNQRNQESRKTRSAGMSQTGDNKVLKTPKASLSPNPVSRVSSIKLRKYRSTLSTSLFRSKTAGLKSSSPLVSSQGLINQRNQNRMTRSADMSQIGDRKVLRTPKASLSPNPVNRVSSIKLRKYRSTLSAAPLKNQAKAGHWEHDTEIVKEKILYVIEPKQENIYLKHPRQKSTKYKSSLASPSSFPSSSPSSSPSVSSHEKHKHNDSDSVSSEASVSKLENKGRSKKPVVSKVDSKPRPRRTLTVGLEDKLPSPHKLKFRRGKVVNLQPENNGPRRLRFRPARALSENQNEVVRKVIKKRIEKSVPDLTTTSLEPPAVVLRHQDVQYRKDSQGLFNHVIEETASKLVETRKSKVKALVGAFETVISLQETK